jgi:ABC-type polysaccharide/polyol phosphate transport system ATPase subunit
MQSLRTLCDRVIELDRGEIVNIGVPEVVIEEYGK